MMTRQCPECSRVFEDEDTLFDHLLDTHGYSMDQAEDTIDLLDLYATPSVNKESKAKESMEDEAGLWWDSLSISDRENLIGGGAQSDSWHLDKHLSWSELQTRPNYDPSQPFFDSSTTVNDILTIYVSSFYKAQGLDDEQWDETGGDWDGNMRPDWSDTGGQSNTWFGSVLNPTLTTRSGNILNYESKAIEDGYSTARRIMKQQIRVMREDGDTDGADDLEWKLENGYYDEFGATGTQNPDLAESHAIEVSSEEEEVGSDLWQALAEGNLLGDYVFGGIFNFEITMPEWATDPQIDVGSIGWFELSDADKQNVVNHFGGVDGMKEKLCDEGWSSYCEDEDGFESKAREDKLDKAQLDIDDEEEFMNQVDIAQKSDNQNPLFDMEALQKKYSMCNSCMDKAFKSLTNESQMADAMYSQWRGTAIGDERNYENWETFALANGVSQQEAIDTWEKLNPSYGFESKAIEEIVDDDGINAIWKCSICGISISIPSDYMGDSEIPTQHLMIDHGMTRDEANDLAEKETDYGDY